MTDRRLIIYHADCVDGFTAAWAAWMRLGDEGGEYVPAAYGSPPPDVTGREVCIVDFSYPRATLIEMHRQAADLVVLDHHKTAEADLAGLPFCHFNMERSGAALAWSHFGVTAAPWLVQYVEDRDLWRWCLPRSKEVNAYLQVAPRTFAEWSAVLGRGVPDAANRGETILMVNEQYVEATRKNARCLTFAGYGGVPVVNASAYAMSELVGSLAEGAPFAVGWWQRADGKYVYSLRSRGDFDVSAVAKHFGGGGHKNAAGFTSDRLLTGEVG